MNAAFAVRFVFPAVFFFVPVDFLAVFELLAMSSPRSGPRACDAAGQRAWLPSRHHAIA
jgi:hypothetical protein